MPLENQGIFAGTAAYYAKYRPGYPPALFSKIERTYGLDGTGTLLDLGCGTGQLSIPLAKHFSDVTALDPD